MATPATPAKTIPTISPAVGCQDVCVDALLLPGFDGLDVAAGMEGVVEVGMSGLGVEPGEASVGIAVAVAVTWLDTAKRVVTTLERDVVVCAGAAAIGNPAPEQYSS
jgi:hypothetical protein